MQEARRLPRRADAGLDPLILAGRDRSAREFSDRPLFFTLAAFLWAASVIPTTLMLIGGTGRALNEDLSYSPSTQALRNVLVIAVVSVALTVIVRRGSTLLNRPFGTLALIAIATLFPSVGEFFHGAGSPEELVMALATVAVAAAVFCLNLSWDSLAIVGLLGSMTGSVSLAMALLRPDAAYVLESGRRVLAGPFDNSNYLGTILVLSLPFVLLIGRRSIRVICIVATVLPITMGASTTSLVALAVYCVLIVGMFFVRKPSGRAALIRVMGYSALGLAGMVPYVIKDPTAFTSRGAIWSLASDSLTDFMPFGAGEEWFDVNSSVTGFSINHAHNVLLQPLVVGGLPYLIVVLAIFLMLIGYGAKLLAQRGSSAPAIFSILLSIAGAAGNFLILDVRDLRFISTGFVVMTMLAIATFESSQSHRFSIHAGLKGRV